MSILDKSVTKGDDGYDFACPVTDGSCAPFRSTGWPTKQLALARGREHFDEHRGLGVTSSLDAFRTKHGLIVTDDGRCVTAEDLA